jgi:hypothetical protein
VEDRGNSEVPDWLRALNEESAERWKARELKLAEWSTFSLRELIGLPDDDVVDALYQAAFRRAEPRIGKLSSTQDLLPRGLFVILCCLALDAEVKNGGFFQFFENTVLHSQDPALTEDVLGCLREIGADAHARLLEFAKAVIPLLHSCADNLDDEPPIDDGDLVMQHFLEGADLLDDAYYALPEIETVLLRYLRAHPEAILG